jgi:hypothetical protein
MASTDGEAPSLEPLPGDDGSGNVNVNILNASESTLPNELEITLRGYDDMVEVYTQTLRLTESEVVRFDDIPLPLERMYFATIEYNNAVYGSDVLVVEPDSPDELNLEITYYAPTTDTSVLQVDRLHVFLSFADEQTLEIFQLYIFSNPTNQVLVPEGNGVAVDFSIPADASNLFVEDTMSMAYKKTGNGFGIVNIYPGETPYQTVFSYQIPYAERNLDLSIPISMDANAVIVMAPAGSLKVKSSQLEDAGSRDFEGISYNMYTGVNLETGKTLELSLSGRPDTAANIFSFNDSSNTSLIIGLAGLGGALIISGIILWYRNRGAEVVEDEWEEEFNGESPEDVMDAIINLDDQYRMGGLPEGAYRVRREELKERLKKIIRNE